MRISKAGALYIAITLLLGFAAVNTGNNLLFLVVSGLLAFMSVTGVAGMLNIRGLTPEILPPAEIFVGSTTPFRLNLRNEKKRLPSFLISIECENGQIVTLPIVPHSSVTETTVYMTFSQRGIAKVGIVRISSPYPVNFFNRFWSFSMDNELIVYPRLLQGVASGDNGEKRRIGGMSQRDSGQDGELERITGYSGREPLRMIHWKLSARLDDLLVKEFGRQSSPPLLIDPDKLGGSTMEERISQAAWLVKYKVLKRPVGLILCGRTIPPASGRNHGALLLKELALHGLD